MKSPDVTPIQALGAAALVLLAAVFGLLAAFGHALSGEQTAAITGSATAFVSVAVAADAVIRNGRAKVVAAAAAAGKSVPKPKK